MSKALSRMGRDVVIRTSLAARGRWLVRYGTLDVGRILVLPQTLVNDLTKQVVFCPCQVFDLDHKLRLISNGAPDRGHTRRAPRRRRRCHQRNHSEAAATEAEGWNVIASA